ncbi:IclR family transcriptional regulator C-terminal domain-containing protein [Streptomyces sp. NPDC000927]|uniref:IclR family transcriptional regulator domain-containing protein n=1 Tax=Streptomyces sp. NPDC000927 TaxID=3154371 RepID=UPI003317170E
MRGPRSRDLRSLPGVRTASAARRRPAATLQRFNEHTVTDFDTLLCRYAEIRRDGASTSHGEYDEAVTAVATPVFHAGSITASLTVIGLAHRVSRVAGQLTQLVREAADEATTAFGG